ncbi:MAG: hypothetical protein GC184_09375 [Rhizobiales bacterium]|nr:hypothetical protein [Hyphomicrobiales bacterium]
MKRLMLLIMAGLVTAVGAALAADGRTTQSQAFPIEERAVIVSALDSQHASPVTGEATLVQFPVYFTASETSPTPEAEMALAAVADEITIRGLDHVKVAPAPKAEMTKDLSQRAKLNDRVLSVSQSLESHGVPARWIEVDLPNMSGV